MKKSLCIFGILLLVLVTGCSNSEKTLVCTRTANQGNAKMDLTYKASYSGKYVSKVTTTEKIQSSSAELLETYKTSVESLYSPYKDIEHYKYNVTIKDDTLISTTDIDYSKIDTDKLIEVDSANKQLIKDGKVNVEDLQQAYESLGAECKEK